MFQVADEGPQEPDACAASGTAEHEMVDADDLVDAAKAQELRLEGNEHFKAGMGQFGTKDGKNRP